MLGALLSLGFLGFAGAKAAYDNYDMKKYTSRYDDKGNLHYMDSHCNDYINGERVMNVSKEDANGINHHYTVGVNSHKVYDDSLGRGTRQLLEYSEQDKQRNLQYGKNAYNQFNPYFHEFVTMEISSGRTITCLFSGTNEKTGKKFYRKWYFRPECQGKLDYNRTVKGDYGIEITKEEYDKLNSSSNYCTCMPSDPKVVHDLWGDSERYGL